MEAVKPVLLEHLARQFGLLLQPAQLPDLSACLTAPGTAMTETTARSIPLQIVQGDSYPPRRCRPGQAAGR